VSDITFAQLLGIYRNTVFEAQVADGDFPGLLTIATKEDLAFLQRLETDNDAFQDAQIRVDEDLAGKAIGDTVHLRCRQPRGAVGRFASNMSDLLTTAGAKLREPAEYFVIEGGLYSSMSSPPEEIAAYKRVLKIIDLLQEAASFVDGVRDDLVFLQGDRLVVHIAYNSDDLANIVWEPFKRFCGVFSDDIHKDQKLTILANAVIRFGASEPAASRFRALLAKFDLLVDEVEKGYKIYYSSFSYSKIRNDLQIAQLDYLSRIHKTFVDIQGQLLGIPVASFVIATQFRTPAKCGIEIWGNTAVTVGAAIFVLLLTISIVNQWLTLGSISVDIGRQRSLIDKNYAQLTPDFSKIFKVLTNRITWHYWILAAVEAIAVAGLIAAFAIYFAFGWPSLTQCLSGAPTPQKTVIDVHIGPA